MRLRSCLSLAVLLAGLATAAPAAPFRIDPDHTAITFSASHLGFSLFHGRFREMKATIDFDPAAIEATKVEFEIDAASIDTGSATRDGHLRAFADLLDVKRYPVIRFVSTGVTLVSAESVRLTGDLTLRDVTLPVTFDVRLNARGQTPLSQGKEVFGFTATGEVDRVKFGMGFAAPAVTAVVPVQIDLEMSPVN